MIETTDTGIREKVARAIHADHLHNLDNLSWERLIDLDRNELLSFADSALLAIGYQEMREALAVSKRAFAALQDTPIGSAAGLVVEAEIKIRSALEKSK